MKTQMLRICLGVFLLLSGYLAGGYSRNQVRAQTTTVIPKSYGKIVGATANLLVFEDSVGTLRLVDYTSGRAVIVNTRN
jgi:hypothetical protein